MSFRPEEVSAVIQKELKQYTTKLEMESRGSVLQVGDVLRVGSPGFEFQLIMTDGSSG